MSTTDFSEAEWLRYSRHIQLAKFGAEGQKKLKQSHLLVVGAGGLGSPVLLYLAAAGVGKITIIDGDSVDVTNLQRQVIFDSKDVGSPKASAAKNKLCALNPHINVDAIPEFFSLENSKRLVANADIVLDCTDNFSTRYLINDRCAEENTPWIFASIYQFSGQCSLFMPGQACFRCLFPEMAKEAQDCSEAGVIGVLPGILGTIQATEAIKYITGLPTPLKNHLLLFDAMNYSSRQIELSQSKECVVCAEGKTAEQLDGFYMPHCNSNNEKSYEISVETFDPSATDIQLIDVRTDAEREAFHIGGTHIPLDSLEKNLALITGDKIVCYCQTGVRSLKAAKILVDQGLNAHSLGGGLTGLLESKQHQRP